MDPAFLKIKELEKANKTREEQLQQERARMQEQRVQAEQARRDQAWEEEVAIALEGSEDSLYQAISRDPNFVKSIVYFQKQHYDEVENTTISIDQAAKMSLENARQTYENLHSIFGQGAAGQSSLPDNGASVGKPTSGASAGKNGRKAVTKTISQRETAEASERDKAGTEQSLESWAEKWGKKADEAQRAGSN
jgi:hypothetical protein